MGRAREGRVRWVKRYRRHCIIYSGIEVNALKIQDVNMMSHLISNSDLSPFSFLIPNSCTS